MPKQSKPKHPLNQSRLFKVTSPERLAAVLNVPLETLRALVALDPAYREFDRPKKTGGLRHCEDPSPPLKALHKGLAGILGRIQAPDFLFCPVKGRCYVSNAAQHRGHRVVHCLDVKKFFPNTPSRRVFWFFNTVLQCRRDVAGLLRDITTFQGRLPTGSPLSPILAYFAFYDMWAEIDQFCRERGYTLTVYIDDVTVSGDKIPQTDLWQIKRIIHRFGLRYHKEKSFIDRPAEVTGVVIRGDHLSAPHRQHRKRKEAAELLRKGYAAGSEIREKIIGLDGQLRQIAKANEPKISSGA